MSSTDNPSVIKNVLLLSVFQGPNDHPLLTWDRRVNHVFSSPGNYSTKVEAINEVGSVFKPFTTVVYGE